MLERLHIQNYRVFNDLKIDQLSRINLIAGKNNSGKTSLLETIFLLAGGGNPQLAINPNIIRGVEPGAAVPQAMVHTFWKHLFSEMDTSSPVKITGHYAPLGQLILEIAKERPRTIKIPLERTGRISLETLSSEQSLVFHYNDSKDQQIEGQISMKGQGFEVKQGDTEIPFPATLLQSRTGSDKEDAIHLGVLRKQKQGHLLLEALRVIEPRLQSIEDNSASGTPMIWGDIGLPELIPLSVMGEGMTRVARMVLAISAAPDGVILVDEIENGLHHSVLPKVWQAVDTTAKQFKTQVFATTHSFECIEAAHEALGADGFLLHRLEASETENRCVTYEPEAISAAMRHYMEVR